MTVDNLTIEDRYQKIWDEIGARLRVSVSEDTYNRWFASIQMVGASEEEIKLRVPNNIYQLWIETNYMPALQSALMEVLHSNPAIRFEVGGENQEPSDNNSSGQQPAVNSRNARKGTAGKPSKESTDSPSGASTNSNSKSPEAAAPAVVGCNPRYIFDSFVVGANNQFAHAAALAVAQAPAKTYNPLFIYGGTGLGKTHLIQAIAQSVAARKKSARVMYITSETFTNEFIDAIQNSTLVKFRKRYRQADLLLIDDIHFLAGKERSQEEFFHTFNALFDRNKQIVLSSDRPASEIATLEHRLVSRFEWGLTAELQPPDMETRLAILRKKALALQVKVPGEVMDFLAERIRSNVRKLEGALIRVASMASLSGEVLDRGRAETLLRDFLQEEAREAVTIDKIQRRVAEYYDVRLADMTSKRRPAHIAFPRQVAMYLSRELTESSLNEIGDAFGGRDHGTVLHACRQVKSKMAAQEKIRQIVSLLSTQLQR